MKKHATRLDGHIDRSSLSTCFRILHTFTRTDLGFYVAFLFDTLGLPKISTLPDVGQVAFAVVRDTERSNLVR